MKNSSKKPMQQSTELKTLFFRKPNEQLYWDALRYAINNDKESALQIVAAIKQRKDVSLLKKRPLNSIDAFFDDIFLVYVSQDPQLLSELGIFESIGIKDHNAYLTDISPQAIIKDLQKKKIVLQNLNNYNSEKLLPDQKISHSVISWMRDNLSSDEKFLFHDYKITQMGGVLSNLAVLFTQFHKLESAYDVQLYLNRLGKIPAQINQAIAFLEQQKKRGIVPPQCAIEKVTSIIQKSIPHDITANAFYDHLAKHIVTVPRVRKSMVLAKAKKILQERVYPAYQKLHDYFVQLRTIATTNHGVWSLPEGDAYYAYILKWHTTTNATPDEIHALGLHEVNRIQQEMRVVLQEEGVLNTDQNLGKLVQEFAKNPQFYYPNTDEGRAQCIVDYEKILERSRHELAHLFDVKPKSSVKIKQVPLHEQDGKPAAYYYSPSIDGSRPGIFFANLRNMEEIPKYGMETLTIHEAEPGHHFQIALQNELPMPMVRKIAFHTAYIEGWALYAEKLAYEANFYSSPAAKLGHLQDELWRAARLVVDTGIHYKRWTREQAIAYMQEVTGFHYDSVVTEVERYLVLPGQACAYKIGQLKILELRERAKKKLGTLFDIKEFHNVVLKVAAVPLTVLEDAVHHYIQNKLA